MASLNYEVFEQRVLVMSHQQSALQKNPPQTNWEKQILSISTPLKTIGLNLNHARIVKGKQNIDP